MTGRQVNPNIGHAKCHLCGETVAVRKNKHGELYYDCLDCGRIAPNHRGGQEKLLGSATIWGPEGAPAGVPQWIAEQWSYGEAIRAHGKPAVQGTPALAASKIEAATPPVVAESPKKVEAISIPALPKPPIKAKTVHKKSAKPSPAKKKPEPPPEEKPARGFSFLD